MLTVCLFSFSAPHAACVRECLPGATPLLSSIEHSLKNFSFFYLFSFFQFDNAFFLPPLIGFSLG